MDQIETQIVETGKELAAAQQQVTHWTSRAANLLDGLTRLQNARAVNAGDDETTAQRIARQQRETERQMQQERETAATLAALRERMNYLQIQASTCERRSCNLTLQTGMMHRRAQMIGRDSLALDALRRDIATYRTQLAGETERRAELRQAVDAFAADVRAAAGLVSVEKFQQWIAQTYPTLARLERAEGDIAEVIRKTEERISVLAPALLSTANWPAQGGPRHAA